jgi:hypothetical protein
MNIYEILDSNGITYKQKERDNVYIECPHCGDDSCSVNIHSGAWHCWSASCEKRGHISQLFDEEFTPSEAPPRERSLTEEDKQKIESSLLSASEVVEFCAKRKLDTEFVLKNKAVGYDKSRNAVVIPFRNKDGVVIGAKYRGDNGDQWIVGTEPELYLPDPNSLKSDRIIIVEGEIDALTLAQFGFPTGATLGAGKTKGFENLRSVKQIYLGYDMDSAGLVGVEKAVASLGHYRCKRIEWTAKDPNDMLKDGATKEQFVEVLKNAKSLLKSTRSTNAADALDEFVIRNKRAVKNRISWGYPRLDSFTKGIGGGMWIGLLAEAGAGKTTFIYNATNNMTNAGINVGICSLEEQTVMEVTPKLTAMHIGRNPGGGDFYPEEVEAAKPVIKKVQLYEGDETRDDVIEWIKECYYAHDVRVIFIDYLQLLFADEKNTEQVKKDCYAFKRLVRKECPDLCIVGIIQPKQKQKLLTREGVVSNDKLDGSDARSGSAINQSVDAMLIIQPVKGHPNLTQLEFTKVRGHLRVSKKDWMGLFTQLEYDHATLRQIEVSNLTYGG